MIVFIFVFVDDCSLIRLIFTHAIAIAHFIISYRLLLSVIKRDAEYDAAGCIRKIRRKIFCEKIYLKLVH